MIQTDLWLEWGGANDGGSRPTHVMLSPEAVKHAGCKPRWFRWVARTPNGSIRGEWIEADK